jgi:hypothetical protein
MLRAKSHRLDAFDQALLLDLLTSFASNRAKYRLYGTLIAIAVIIVPILV